MSELLNEVNVPRNRLLEDMRYQRAFVNHVKHVKGLDQYRLPRYGVLTLLARRVPFYLYDHPVLLKLSDTAFTEGSAVFVSVPFFEQVTNEDRVQAERGTPTASAIFLLLHELKHIALRHTWRRPRNAGPVESEIRNIAEDIYINMRLWRGFEDRLPIGPLLLGDPKTGLPSAPGCSYDDIKQYWHMTEEQIYQTIRSESEDAMKRYMEGYEDGLQAGKDSSEGSAPSDEQDENGKAGKSKESQQGGGIGALDPEEAYKQGYEDGKNSRNKPFGSPHTVRPEDLREVLENAGMKDIADKLGLPKKGDMKALAEAESRFTERVKSAASEARQLRAKHGSKLAGGHVESAIGTAIQELYEPTLSWRVALRELIVGEGIKQTFSEVLPDSIYYQTPESIGIADPVYEGVMLPAENRDLVQVIIDTSGSVDDVMLRRFFTEAFGIVQEDELAAPRIQIFSADTAVRGTPLEVGPNDWEEKLDGLRAYGRGGTDFTGPLKSVLSYAKKQRENVVGVVYFTDTYASPPTWEVIPDPMPPVIFVAPAPSADVEAFRMAVKGKAEVYAIDETASVKQEIEIAGPSSPEFAP